jgi:uncharacterized membrane protein SpoIIM required for sporulation
MVKKNNFFLREFFSSWNFIKNIKNYIYFSIFIFFFFAFIGFFIPLPEEFIKNLLENLAEIVSKTEGLNLLGLIRFIFFNNLLASFSVFLFGVLFGIFPIISSAFNGIVLGFVASMSLDHFGFFSLWRILPHGIFELPAIFISFGMGLKMGIWLIIDPIKFYWKRKKTISFLFILFYLPSLLLALYFDISFRKKMMKSFFQFQEDFLSSLKTFIVIVIPLLLIAAIIEGFLIYLF